MGSGEGIGSDRGTDLFLGLTPDVALGAIEATGLRCTSVCFPCNSFENRVFEIELADPARTRRVAKFYRPGRWSEGQIREEHAYLRALAEAEVPVCAVVTLPTGDTLSRVGLEGSGGGQVWFCLFERQGGRAPEEIDGDLAERLGALTGRMHNVGAKLPVRHRAMLTAERLETALDWLLAQDLLPLRLRHRYESAARKLAEVTRQRLRGVDALPIHGDLHAGNLLVREGVLHVLDFDDMARGPAVQDLWLLLPGRDAETLRLRGRFLQGYEQFRDFDRATLQLIEPLRAVRYVDYSAWLARRWHDPIFPAMWPQFGTERWWQDATDDLEDVLDHLDAPTLGDVPVDEAAGASRKDYFWDLD